MKRRIIALACGTCFLIAFSSGCPCGYSSYTNSAKTGMNHIASAQPAVNQVVVAPSKAAGL
jgi:hypothetical protein